MPKPPEMLHIYVTSGITVILEECEKITCDYKLMTNGFKNSLEFTV